MVLLRLILMFQNLRNIFQERQYNVIHTYHADADRDEDEDEDICRSQRELEQWEAQQEKLVQAT